MSRNKSELLAGTFWTAVAERAVKTFAQALAAVFAAGAVDVLAVPWQSALSVAAGAALVSVLTSVGSAALTGDGPSLTNSESVIPD